MKSRKPRTAKSGSSRKKAPSDVSPSTSLPPLVEGQLRCFLRVTISRVLWTVFKPPSATFVRLRWWGESSNGTHFFPRDSAQLSQKTIKTTTRFPIRCGPKQFTSYLADMGSLVPEVLTKADHLSVARTQVPGISRLSMLHPIGGFYTLVSPTSEKLGELQVSLSLEPLVDAYDSSSSSGFIADTSTEREATTLTVPALTASFTAGSSKKSPENSSATTPKGRDHLYFQSAQRDSGPDDTVENQVPLTNRSQNIQTTVNPSSQESCGQPATDILSVLLQRGNKLRDAMVMSANKYDTHSAPTLKDVPLPLQKNNVLPPLKPPTSPSRVFLQNVSHVDSTHELPDNVAAVPDCRVDFPADIDSRAVDLLLGSINTSPLPVWDGEGTFPESLSGCSSICEDSELNDPQYDQSLLENLFYKSPISNTMVEDTEVAVGDAALLKKNLSKKGSSSRQQQQTQSGHNPESEPQQPVDDGAIPLSAEQLSLLELIRLARVTIDSVGTATILRRTPTKGKPAHLVINKKCTYFVEYTFPLSSATNRYRHGRAAEGKVIRAVSSKLVGEVVEFNHKSTFPVKLNKTTVEHWWEIDLSFNIYSRRSDQKKPVLVGKAAHPLRCLLQSKDMSESVTLPIQSVEAKSETHKIGPLKVSLELAANHVHRPAEKKKLSWGDLSPSHSLPTRQRDPGSLFSYGETGSEEVPAPSLESPRVIISSPQRPERDPSPHPIPYTIPHESWQEVEEDPEVLLHTLLMVPDGKDFSCVPKMAPNVYLNCKLFWCDETARSVVSWGQANPSFNFVQVTPVTLTARLLQRMKNNVMVVEVWQKMGSSGQDRLLGLVKLPLHQFYMSFRDAKIAHLLLQAQYPVLGVDGYMPVIDVFSGNCKGNLRVVLAIGRSEQILALQRARDEESSPACVLVRPVHLLDHLPHGQTQTSPARDVMTMREHVFVIRVERVNGLTPLQSTVWGEADCYVQYSFPHQEADSAANSDTAFDESSINLKPFRTTTTLCVPDPMFGHTETHVLLAPEGAPVQNLLLSSLSSQGLSSGGGVQFDVWCRYYYPNVRDQMVARGLLPLSKLCAMVTMQRQNPNEAQMFSLPLVPRADDPQQHPHQPSGLLDVCVRYKHRPIRPQRQTGRGVASRIVTLVVQVHRASGLQAAARILSEQDDRFSYFATLGVNAYVTVQLSFLPENERRSTRVAARTFCPEFDHHMEVSCDLLLQRSSGESCSLAEQLEDASAVFTIWNRDSRKASVTSKAKDVMLGTVKIPLAGLIHKRTGISGWFGVYVPMETSSSQEQHTLVGGLEISLSFAHHSDRERVIKAAQGLGWDSALFERERRDDNEAWGESRRKFSLSLSMPRAWIPLHCLLLPGHGELQRSTYCYFRYKFYDQNAFCSPMKHPTAMEGGREIHATVNFEGSRTIELTSSQPLMWYLQEERLEVQVWAAFQKDKTQRPSDTDRLVGSAFIDLSSLAKTHKEKLMLSGVYPLFRRSAADLQGAALRVHVTLNSGSDHDHVPPVAQDDEVDTDSQGEHLLEEIEEEDEVDPPQQSHAHGKHQRSRATPDITSVRHAEVSEDESFPVTVTVDRALNLNLKGCPSAERAEGTPCCCVSYVTADSDEPASTAVIANTNCPVWDHQHECRLSKELLVDPQQSLVFKVWHKGEMERVIGFASVDLSPLLYGLRSVCGWYNITDFGGRCHGQLKVSVTPLKWIQDLRGQRKAAAENAAKNTPTKPVSYHTKATYSSFPSHISRYPEQEISSPDPTDTLFSESRSSESDRHREHMDSVRLFHRHLKRDQMAIGAGDNNPTTGFSSLRKKLSELDNMQRHLARKLSAPIYTAVSKPDCRNKHEVPRESDMDADQLLLRSSQLVQEINYITGLRDQHLETIPSNSESNSPTSPVADDNLQSIGGVMSSSGRAPVSPREPAPLLRTPRHVMDTAVEHRKGHQQRVVVVSDEDEEETDDDECRLGCRKEAVGVEEEEEDEDDEDYEEFVLKPRALNEVTSLTDRTSPWTSVLSEPDMVCLESLESQEAEPNQDGDDGPSTSRAGNLHLPDGEDHQSGSSSDASDAEENAEQTLHVADEEPAEEELSSTGAEASPTRRRTARACDSSRHLDSQDRKLQASVPNFFLPTHQLEASLRAIRLAPSFSKAFCDTERRARNIPHRGPRQPPNMSPTSRKKAERIAKIFAAHFDVDQ